MLWFSQCPSPPGIPTLVQSPPTPHQGWVCTTDSMWHKWSSVTSEGASCHDASSLMKSSPWHGAEGCLQPTTSDQMRTSIQEFAEDWGLPTPAWGSVKRILQLGLHPQPIAWQLLETPWAETIQQRHFWTHKSWKLCEIISVWYFKLLQFGLICFIAINCLNHILRSERTNHKGWDSLDIWMSKAWERLGSSNSEHKAADRSLVWWWDSSCYHRKGWRWQEKATMRPLCELLNQLVIFIFYFHEVMKTWKKKACELFTETTRRLNWGRESYPIAKFRAVEEARDKEAGWGSGTPYRKGKEKMWVQDEPEMGAGSLTHWIAHETHVT